MPTIVGILTFMNMINVILTLVEQENSFITATPVLVLVIQCFVLVMEYIRGSGAPECIFHNLCLFLFDLILYVPSTIFQLYRDGSSWVEPVLS